MGPKSDTSQQMINNFKEITQLATNDVSGMVLNNGKLSLEARQDCLNVVDIPQCLQGLRETADDPSQILKVKRADDPTYNESEQLAICSSFHEVCFSTESTPTTENRY